MSAQALKGTLAHVQQSDHKAQIPQAEALSLLTVRLKSTNESQIADTLRQLTTVEADQLLELVYLGLAQAQAPMSSLMFRWHEQIISVFGLGSVMRALTG